MKIPPVPHLNEKSRNLIFTLVPRSTYSSYVLMDENRYFQRIIHLLSCMSLWNYHTSNYSWGALLENSQVVGLDLNQTRVLLLFRFTKKALYEREHLKKSIVTGWCIEKTEDICFLFTAWLFIEVMEVLCVWFIK